MAKTINFVPITYIGQALHCCLLLFSSQTTTSTRAAGGKWLTKLLIIVFLKKSIHPPIHPRIHHGSTKKYPKISLYACLRTERPTQSYAAVSVSQRDSRLVFVEDCSTKHETHSLFWLCFFLVEIQLSFLKFAFNI